MTSVQQRQYYYKQMLDLQERCRKSEEERLRLEEKYNKLIQESQIRHEACINRLRLRYIKFLEEQQARDERNNKLLGALDKVDSDLALIATKTERLNTLKKQYELSISRSIEDDNDYIGDSGVASQNDQEIILKNKLQRSRVTESSPLLTSSSLYNRFDNRVGSTVQYQPSSVQSWSPLTSPKKFYSYSTFTLPQSSRIASPRNSKIRIPSAYNSYTDSCYLPQSFAKTPFLERNNDSQSSTNVPPFYKNSGYYRNDLPIYGRAHYTIDNFQKRNVYSADNSPRDYKFSNLSTLMEKSAKLLSMDDQPKYTSTPYKLVSSLSKKIAADIDAADLHKSIESLENKLDRYIQQIRKLHGPTDSIVEATAEMTCEDYNTSGDLLNESLSEDGIPTCESNEKIDLAAVKPQPECDENINPRTDGNRLETENVPAGVVDKFATSVTNVSALETSPESTVAPEASQNNITPSPTEIVEIRPNEEDQVKEKKDDEILISEIDSETEDVKQKESDNIDLEEGAKNEETGNSQHNPSEENVKTVEIEGEEGSNAIEEANNYEYAGQSVCNQYGVQEYNATENQEYVEQNYAQSSDQNYYQEYQVENPNQNNEQIYNEQYEQSYEGQNYEGQNYDQYQYEDPNQVYQEHGEYSNPEQYTEENVNQRYEYNYDDPNTSYGANEKHANYEVTNDQIYTETREEGQHREYNESEDMNGHSYERDDYAEHKSQGYTDAEPAATQNERDAENTPIKKRDNSDSESTLERNTVSNVESDFDFN